MGEGGEGVIGWISLNEFNFNGRVGRHRPAGYKKNPIETMERGEKKIVLDGWAREIGRHGDQSDFFVFVSCANWFLFCWFRLPFFRVWTQKKSFRFGRCETRKPARPLLSKREFRSQWEFVFSVCVAFFKIGKRILLFVCVLDLRFFSLLASNENDNQVREREEKENCTFFCVFEQIFALANRNRCVWLWCRWWKLVPSRSMTPLVPEPDAQNRSGRVWLDGAETGNSQFCNSPRRHVHLVPQTHEHTRTCTHTHTHTRNRR